jgi:hypothetical protein
MSRESPLTSGKFSGSELPLYCTACLAFARSRSMSLHSLTFLGIVGLALPSLPMVFVGVSTCKFLQVVSSIAVLTVSRLTVPSAAAKPGD